MTALLTPNPVLNMALEYLSRTGLTSSVSSMIDRFNSDPEYQKYITNVATSYAKITGKNVPQDTGFTGDALFSGTPYSQLVPNQQLDTYTNNTPTTTTPASATGVTYSAPSGFNNAGINWGTTTTSFQSGSGSTVNSTNTSNQLATVTAAAAKQAANLEIRALLQQTEQQAQIYDYNATTQKQNQATTQDYLRNYMGQVGNKVAQQFGQTRQQYLAGGYQLQGSAQQVLMDVKDQGLKELQGTYLAGRSQLESFKQQADLNTYQGSAIRAAGQVQAQNIGLLADIQTHRYY